MNDHIQFAMMLQATFNFIIVLNSYWEVRIGKKNQLQEVTNLQSPRKAPNELYKWHPNYEELEHYGQKLSPSWMHYIFMKHTKCMAGGLIMRQWMATCTQDFYSPLVHARRVTARDNLLA